MNTLNHILCPVDFSPDSYKTIEQASFLAQLFQADLTLIHVVGVLPQSFGVVYGLDVDSKNLVDKATENARDLLREAKQKYVPYAVTCKSSVRYGKIAEEVVKEIEKINADLVIMATRGADNTNVQLLGNHVMNVMKLSSCPVLTYSAGGERKGFRKILIGLDQAFGIHDMKSYIDNYFSLTGPEIELVTVISPDSNGKAEATWLETQKRGFDESTQSFVKINVLRGESVSETIVNYAQEKDYNLIMINTHGKSGLGKPTVGAVASQIVLQASTPVFTVRPS